MTKAALPRPALSLQARATITSAVLALLTLLTLVLTSPAIGYVRDEGVYFEASRRYTEWLDSIVTKPTAIANVNARDRAFAFNAEHPPLMKMAAGISASALSRHIATPGKKSRNERTDGTSTKRAQSESQGQTSVGWLGAWLDEGAAMRLPAHMLAALGVALLAYVGFLQAGLGGALLAAGAFILLPHVAYHAALHTFDVPVAVLILATVLCWHRALESIRWALACGLMLGLAVATKHNALFLGPLLAMHYWIALASHCRQQRRLPARYELIPFPVLALGLALPVLVLLWPWLWHDTVARLYEYLYFHGAHAYYNVEYLGQNFNRPPLPWSYPWVMTLATVPATILALALVGGIASLSQELHAVASWSALTPRVSPSSTSSALAAASDEFVVAPTRHPASFWRPLPQEASRLRRLSWILLAVFPIALISVPSVPIFGGTKHWITAYPFVALLAVDGLAWLALAVTARATTASGTTATALASASYQDTALHTPRLAAGLLLAAACAIAPGAVATVHGHPHNVSQYAPLVGGPRGAANLGLQRGFWGGAALDFLPPSDSPPQAPGPIDVHDLHDLARHQYVRERSWPLDWQPVSAQPGGRARSALHFYEAHMLADEIRVWNSFARTDPAKVVTIDDVPIASLYIDAPLP